MLSYRVFCLEIPCDNSFIDQACSVKISGYCLSTLIDLHCVLVHKHTQIGPWPICGYLDFMHEPLDCSQSPIFLRDRRCQSLSLMGLHPNNNNNNSNNNNLYSTYSILK